MKYKSDILEIIHENATANFEIGAISKERMCEYDEMCLVKEKEKAPQHEASEEENLPDTVLSGGISPQTNFCNVTGTNA